MNGKSMSLPEIRRAGLEALRERLGVDGMHRFLRLYSSGSGDYTTERKEWLKEETVTEIAERIRGRQKTSE